MVIRTCARIGIGMKETYVHVRIYICRYYNRCVGVWIYIYMYRCIIQGPRLVDWLVFGWLVGGWLVVGWLSVVGGVFVVAWWVVEWEVG